MPVQCLRTILALGFVAGATMPALAASCRDEIASLDARVKAGAITSTKTAAPPHRSQDAVPAGDPAVQARALLNRAHTLAQRGDDDACRATLALAQKQLSD